MCVCVCVCVVCAPTNVALSPCRLQSFGLTSGCAGARRQAWLHLRTAGVWTYPTYVGVYFHTCVSIILYNICAGLRYGLLHVLTCSYVASLAVFMASKSTALFEVRPTVSVFHVRTGSSNFKTLFVKFPYSIYG